MTDAGVGRLLVASLHQGIADVMPSRLEFYETWFHARGLRDGRIGLAQLVTVLSFLRLEGADYYPTVERAGEYAADWTVEELSRPRRLMLRVLPTAVRTRLVVRLARRMVSRTYGGSRVLVTWRRGGAAVDIRGSIFCEVRDRTETPLCDYYASALRRLFQRFNVPAEVISDSCRATGAGQCALSIVTGPVVGDAP